MKLWLQKAGIRAIKTMAQTALSMFTVGQLVTEVNWVSVLSVSAVAGFYSLLTSIKGLPELDDNKAVVKEDVETLENFDL